MQAKTRSPDPEAEVKYYSSSGFGFTIASKLSFYGNSTRKRTHNGWFYVKKIKFHLQLCHKISHKSIRNCPTTNSRCPK